MLLTREDFDDRQRYLNVRNTLSTLLTLPTIPVINENYTVSTDEINFGDNDLLSALVTGLLGAELLLLLTDVGGLYEPGGKKPLEVVEKVTDEVRRLATSEKSGDGTG